MRHRVVPVAILLLATALRLHDLTAQSLWFDEGISAHIATQPLSSVLAGSASDHPPLYYLLINFTARAAGDDPFALRSLSVLLGVITVALIARLASDLFGRRAGYLAALLAAISPALWWSSQEARMYSLATLAITLAALAWFRLVAAPTRRHWLLLWLAELLVLYAHSTGTVQVLWLNAATILFWLARRSIQCPYWRTWFAGQIAVFVLWLPWIAHFLHIPTNRKLFVLISFGPGLLSSMWQTMWVGTWAMVDQEPVMVGLSVLLLVLTIVLLPWGNARARWLVVHLLVLAGGLLVSLRIAGIAFNGRYVLMVLPFLLAALGGGLARLLAKRPALAALCLVPFLLDSWVGISLAMTNPNYARDDARAMVRYYRDTLGPHDSVIAWAAIDRFDLAYYWTRLGVQAQRVILHDGMDLESLPPVLPSGGRVAVNEWSGERASDRHMLKCVLAHGTSAPPVEYSVHGMTNLLYASPSSLPALQPFSARWTVAQAIAVGTLPGFTADQALCLPVRITLTQATAHNLNVALIVRNSLGWEIAHTDALFADAYNRPAYMLKPGATLTAFPLVRLPYGAPAEDYVLTLRLYDDEGGSGYDLLDAGGTASGTDLALGSWRPRPGADWSRVARANDLPVQANLPAGGLTLIAHNAGGAQPIHAGDRLQWWFLWQGSGPLPALVLRAADGSWSVDLPPSQSGDHAPITLDWREARVPPDVLSGAAELVLPDHTLVARYTLDAPPAVFAVPGFATPVGARLPGLGELAGYTLEGTSFARTQPVSVTLVWRAEKSSAVPYKVFVHLVSADGRLLAQSDAEPMQGLRPTTGWRPGEYIVDVHQLGFHPDAFPGPATLRVGFYNAVDLQRLLFASGVDAWPLPAVLDVR